MGYIHCMWDMVCVLVGAWYTSQVQSYQPNSWPCSPKREVWVIFSLQSPWPVWPPWHWCVHLNSWSWKIASSVYCKYHPFHPCSWISCWESLNLHFRWRRCHTHIWGHGWDCQLCWGLYEIEHCIYLLSGIHEHVRLQILLPKASEYT